ncbi:MAG: hypothetical protein JJE03_00005 [Peptostreptococcaceae bacterium]|nr:hypothetical protein [Peptostreptococcaceae bacterium]
MERTLIILTKSRKYYGYCIAGKDLETGEWIRIIDNDMDKHNSIQKKDCFYTNGGFIKLLDGGADKNLDLI